MTEPRLATMFAAIKAMRDASADRAGRIAACARRSVQIDIASELEGIAREEAAGLEVLTRIVDQAMESTQSMSFDEVAR
jgi:hypothetical protein